MKRIAPVLLLLATTALAASAHAAEFFVPGNLVVSVEGNGVPGALSGPYTDNQAAPMSLFQYTTGGQLVNTLQIAPANFSGEYGSSSEGFLQLTGNGKALTIMGYGVNAQTFNANPGAYSLSPTNTALGQSGSMTGQSYIAVPRDVAVIGANGVPDIAASVYGVYNGNNPRSVYSADGSTFYISGQGNSPDQTGGVFEVGTGVTHATLAKNGITGDDTTGKTSTQDTRFITGVNGKLYVSVDSKEGSNSARDFIGTLGAVGSSGLYDSGNGPTELTNFSTSTGKVTETSSGGFSNGNGLFGPTAKVNLSPEEFFFASDKTTDDTLYIADSGNPKNDSNTPGTDGGLQKWSLVNGTWVLDYTLTTGLIDLVKNTAASGTTGLFGLTGEVVNGEVELFATNATKGDTDQTYLYGITDNLADMTAAQAAGEHFTELAEAPVDSNFKGVSFAPVPEPTTWALMLGGFGLAGAALRRRRRRRAVVA